MKRLNILLAVMGLALAFALGAQAQVLRDANYEAFGRIAPNGTVRGTDSMSMGFFDADGTIKDKAGNVLGRINRLEIFDNEGNRIGYINTNGTVRNGNSEVLGNINLSDGKVTDAEHHVLGYARGIRVDWIACYFFFDFFKK
ncbi:MAG: hypothetical protein J5565_04110 [Muribaculaceae bacterium]|nr:hypothetical protein [Muribaculaceae bacterium]